MNARIFPIWGSKNIFFKKFSSVILSYGSLKPCCVLEKTKEPIPRKLPERRIDLIHRTLLVMGRDQIRE